ncbi:hypothetical protein JAAARDRAFT_197209 [Jaapia argillacea MUCL 33604]|uniref:Uncharacterized protein n=1 Tax=Jaapia argillacea MUCL 33604 TaxID=933084 RepID=A0A067PFS8_9AGAM|nr:hypothetical protein JAAARDRAFT_197209 [Jaapia argillacea MUCL 33604]
MHCQLAGNEIQKLKTKINLKVEKAKGRKSNQFQTQAKFLTSAECDGYYLKQAGEKAEKARIEAEKLAAKESLEKQHAEERLRVVGDPTVSFSGNLKTHKKPYLQTVAFTLVLLTEGTNATLVNNIVMKLKDNPHLASNTRYSGLCHPDLVNMAPNPVQGESSRTEPTPEPSTRPCLPLSAQPQLGGSSHRQIAPTAESHRFESENIPPPPTPGPSGFRNPPTPPHNHQPINAAINPASFYGYSLPYHPLSSLRSPLPPPQYPPYPWCPPQ